MVKFVGKYLSGVIISCIVAVLVVTVYRKNGGYESLCVKDLVETIKISVTVLISMLGFSVSIYVFLNNSFQSRRSANATEKQIIDKFQKEKRKSLGIRITFAVIAIICECAVVTLTNSINLSTKIYSISEFLADGYSCWNNCRKCYMFGINLHTMLSITKKDWKSWQQKKYVSMLQLVIMKV